MLIVHESGEMVKFTELGKGEVFMYNDSYCMKISAAEKFNMVYLANGEVGFMYSQTEVERVNCELVVKS